MDVLTFDRLPAKLRSRIQLGDRRMHCPKCGGGRQRELSLSVYQETTKGQLKLSCWRASCGWWALVLFGDDVKIVSKQVKQARVYYGDISPITDAMHAELRGRYNLDKYTYGLHGWGMNSDGYLVMPVVGIDGDERGHMLHGIDPKWRDSYKNTAKPYLDYWSPSGESGGMIVVEDSVSACRLAGLGYHAIALLGTNMSTADAKEIATFAARTEVPLWIALDNDAWHKSVKMKDRFSHILPLEGLIALDQDIKDMQWDSDIRIMLRSAGANGRDETTSGDTEGAKTL